MNKSLATLKSELTALFESGAAITPAALLSKMIDVVDSLEASPYLKAVTDYTAAASLEEVTTTDRTVGELILVMINNHVVQFKLMAGTEATYSPLIIRPNDYNAETNAKYWMRSDVKFLLFDTDDLDESYDLTWEHDTGIKFPEISIFDGSEVELIQVHTGDIVAGSYKVTCTDNDTVTISFARALVGNYKLIARF